MKTIPVLFLIATMAISAAAECNDADRKALEAFDHAWTVAGQSGDKVKLMTIYADDFMAFPGMSGKAAAIDGTMATFERNKANPAGANKSTSDHYRISCTPTTATITHRNTVWTPDGAGGKPETFYSRSVHILEKRGGKWQVISNVGNDLDDYAVLWYLEQDWNDAVLKKNKEWFEKNYASDFTAISSTSGKLFDRAGAIADDTDPNVTMEIVETTGMNIRIDGNYAVITGVFRTKGKDEKAVGFDRKIRYTDVWVKRDGRWQAWSSQGTIMPQVDNVAKN